MLATGRQKYSAGHAHGVQCSLIKACDTSIITRWTTISALHYLAPTHPNKLAVILKNRKTHSVEGRIGKLANHQVYASLVYPPIKCKFTFRLNSPEGLQYIGWDNLIYIVYRRCILPSKRWK